jgi:hypothetical protein
MDVPTDYPSLKAAVGQLDLSPYRLQEFDSLPDVCDVGDYELFTFAQLMYKHIILREPMDQEIYREKYGLTYEYRPTDPEALYSLCWILIEHGERLGYFSCY